MRRWGPWLVGLFLVAGGAGAFAATRGSDQRQVTADALPVLPGARRLAVYVDCSKINGVTYDGHNPCQTFVLLQGSNADSDEELWAAETRQLRASGWRHSATLFVDFDTAHGGMARQGESWVSPARDVCAYVTTRRRGVAAEARELFPYDPYDNPKGVYDFYRTARDAGSGHVLWVRLRPPNQDGHCIG